jgi:hypothetical protein
MSAGARTLRLGPLPKTETVKMTVAVSVELKTMLDRYAELHGQAWGEPVDAATLIPHMLDAFMVRDRAFRKAASTRAGRSDSRASPAGRTQCSTDDVAAA